LLCSMLFRKVVIGLGNPGMEYQNTPHNLGFDVVDLLVSRSGGSWKTEECSALTTRMSLGEFDILLAKPQTFMNLSGKAVAELMEKYEISVDDCIVVCDDLALPFGKIRVRGQGSSGGHKGLESIIEWLNSSEFTRVRLGIAPAFEVQDAAGYVLSPISRELRDLSEQMVRQGKEAVEMICSSGLQATMNKFN
jgi:PTH1 family peptidyl-tRNA hydrolase